VDCCIFVDEFGDGEITVKLIPEDEASNDRFDVLGLPADKQRTILAQLRTVSPRTLDPNTKTALARQHEEYISPVRLLRSLIRES